MNLNHTGNDFRGTLALLENMAHFMSDQLLARLAGRVILTGREDDVASHGERLCSE